MKNKQRSFQLTGDFLSFESNELEASLLFKMFMREMRKKRGRSLATRMEPRRVEVTIRFFEPEATKPEQNVS